PAAERSPSRPVREPPALEPPAPRLAAEPSPPRPVAAARRERPAAPAADLPDTEAESRKRASTPRPRDGSEVRMHNGVPLLD
ncbi:MAG TPA: hypothetical protein VHM31_21575, partial [Polyangia bacterium]|nr:hypothetical protein [Polyangia bacterium]